MGMGYLTANVGISKYWQWLLEFQLRLRHVSNQENWPVAPVEYAQTAMKTVALQKPVQSIKRLRGSCWMAFA
jgi:hypothetical protein